MRLATSLLMLWCGCAASTPTSIVAEEHPPATLLEEHPPETVLEFEEGWTETGTAAAPDTIIVKRRAEFEPMTRRPAGAPRK